MQSLKTETQSLGLQYSQQNNMALTRFSVYLYMQ